MVSLCQPLAFAAHELAGGHRLVKLSGLALMLLLHGAIVASVFNGKTPAPRIPPMRNAVVATLLAGPVQPDPAPPSEAPATPEPAVAVVRQDVAPPAAEPPASPPPPDPPKREPVATPREPRVARADRLPEQHSKSREQAAHPEQPARVAAVTPPAMAAPAAGKPAPSAASDNVPAPAASIAPGIQCKTPEYPKASRRLTEEGIVSLRFLVDSDGRVLNAEVEKSSGYSRLDDAARNALSLCQFRPGEVDGKPVKSWARINYSWKLK